MNWIFSLRFCILQAIKNWSRRRPGNETSYVKLESPKKQHCARGGTNNEGRHHLLLLHKQVHDKRGIAESLHAYINTAGLTAPEVGIFSEEIS